MDAMDYIVKDAYILIPVLYILGMFLKKTPKIKNWMIPWILLGVGIVGGFFVADMKLDGILQGILVTGVTVFANQLYKQTVCKTKDSDKTVNKTIDSDKDEE